MTTLTVLYVRDTDSVVAALTQTAPPAATQSASDLVGRGLRMRGLGKIDITLAADRLALAVIDADPGVLVNPRGFYVEPTPQNPGKLKLTPVQASAAVKLSLSLSAAGADLTRTVTGAPMQVLLVLEKIASPAPDPVILTGAFEASSTRITLPAALDKGDWKAACFATRQLPSAKRARVS
jgi:hypothetical protein